MNSGQFDPRQLLPPDRLRDPRAEGDFCPALWPLCNGTILPSMSRDLHERRCLELISAYYELNRQLALPEATNSTCDGVAQARRAITELEDRYAPLGFYGEPIFESGVCRDVGILRPGLPVQHSENASLSSQFVIPGLDELPTHELSGPPVLRRWSHG